MPVELPDGEPPEAAPAPPLAIVWLALFVAFMLAGVVSTLLTWPKTEPTGSAWFWMRLLGLPALAWCVAFGLRLHYYDEESERRRAEKEARQEDRDKALLFASEPLAVVGCAYLSAPGSEDLASKIAEGGPALKAQTSRAGSNAVRHTALDLLEDKNMPGRYRACFRELLNQVADAVTAVPRNVPLDVRLQLPADADRESLLDTWHACWGARDLRPVNATLLSSERGLMALDEWLDIRGGPSLEKFTLFVSIQLHDTPPQNSAEAAVALLLGWAQLAERRELKALAMLHRPVEVGATAMEKALPKVLLWGKTTPLEINDVWQAGLGGPDKPALLRCASDLSLGVSQAGDFSGIHDIDMALGSAGIVAGWLAAALAIEHAAQNGAPQLIAWREGTLRFAVAQPTTQADGTESWA